MRTQQKAEHKNIKYFSTCVYALKTLNYSLLLA